MKKVLDIDLTLWYCIIEIWLGRANTKTLRASARCSASAGWEVFMTTYRTKSGVKLYPVCNWEKNQHKVYCAHDRIEVRYWEAIEAGDYAAAEQMEAWKATVDLAMEWIDHTVGDLVYAPWEAYKAIKSVIGGYDFRHDFGR